MIPRSMPPIAYSATFCSPVGTTLGLAKAQTTSSDSTPVISSMMRLILVMANGVPSNSRGSGKKSCSVGDGKPSPDESAVAMAAARASTVISLASGRYSRPNRTYTT